MKIIAGRTLRLFREGHLRAETPLQVWFAMVRQEDRNDVADVGRDKMSPAKAGFGTTVVLLTDKRVVFTIGGEHRFAPHVAHLHDTGPRVS